MRRVPTGRRFEKLQQQVSMLVDDAEYSNFVKSYKSFLKKHKIKELSKYLEEVSKENGEDAKRVSDLNGQDQGSDSESALSEDENPENKEINLD